MAGQGGSIMRCIRWLAAAAALALAAPALPDDYQANPVGIIVPADPGGINDVGARTVEQHRAERLGKQFLSESKSGAGGMVGTEDASRQPADGYTIAVISVANAVHPALYKLS